MAHQRQVHAEVFHDRRDAAIALAKKLQQFKNDKNCIVIGLPRGGVVTGYWICKHLNLPLDTVITRKIGCPGNPEFAVGSISEDGHIYLNERLIEELEFTKKDLNPIIQAEFKEAKRRVDKYRNGKPLEGLQDKIIILADDGVATGATCGVALECLRRFNPKKVILATPVISPDTLEKMEKKFDEVVYVSAPIDFMSVGQFYYNFDQTEDEEVIRLIESNRNEMKAAVQASSG